ncbi:hypothetical protein GOBAR_AA16588 [Gossypium barbadense]|uniref:cyclin-dependent kinase n=1 Tax=Gossypium barbadense TaxID=3634 RepID=A0A2P5XL44_GOSBA|nr:hypothetical protein GOBAR_AA16588 [Gossypium barbadense]
MAAGRVDVRRRIDVEKLNRGHVHANPVKNGYNYPSNHKNKFDLGPRRCGLDDVARVKNDVKQMMDDGVQQPPEKREEVFPDCMGPGRQGRKNFIQEQGCCDDYHSVISFFTFQEVEHMASKSLVSDFGAALSPSLPEQQCQDDEQEPELIGKENVRAPNIFTSRWASDSDDEDGSLTEEKIRRSSSLESGELEREELEVDRVQSDQRSSSVLSACEDGGMDYLGVEEPAGGCMNMLHGCRSVFEYEKLNKISEGTYGIVYRAKDKLTGEIVALKKVKILDLRDLEEYGFPVISLREINILASFHHPSIVKSREVVVDDHDNVYMVMEYMEHDLKWLMDSMKRRFSTSDVKCLMLQLLEGVKYLHDNWVLHRDLKTSNLLLNNQGELKICDFGMARQYGSPLKPYTTKVVTQWYRAPELLLGRKKYSTAVDMWSVGCVMAELLAKEPLFKGTAEIDQLRKIFDTLGVPSEKIWPGFSELPGSKANYSKQPYNLLRKKFPAASFTGSAVLSDAGFDLLNRLLTYDPEKRITADDALNHDWFRELPLPKSKDFLPTFPPKV